MDDIGSSEVFEKIYKTTSSASDVSNLRPDSNLYYLNRQTGNTSNASGNRMVSGKTDDNSLYYKSSRDKQDRFSVNDWN